MTSEQPNASNDAAELSSITTVLADMQTRVVEVADRWRAVERDDVAGDLYEVERSLRNAQRRIRRAVQGDGAAPISARIDRRLADNKHHDSVGRGMENLQFIDAVLERNSLVASVGFGIGTTGKANPHTPLRTCAPACVRYEI